MASVSQRLWRAPGQRARRKAWGFTVQVDGKQKRVYKAEWTKDDAEQALAAVLLKTEQQPKAKARGLTLAMAAARYVETKARKRSLGDDIRILKHLEESFGADTPLSEITASRIAEYKGKRLSTVRKTGQGGAATERPLEIPRWNFHKYLVGRDGRIAAVFPTAIEPMDARLIQAVAKELART